MFIAEGPKIVVELLQNKNVEVQSVYGLTDWIHKNEPLLTRVNVVHITETELERMSQLKTPNTVIAVSKKLPVASPEVRGKISLILDEIQDPGNLGTIIRTAEWFGVSQIVCSPDTADVYNPKVIQATMGSIARVNVFYCDLVEWLDKEHKVTVFATTLDGKPVTNYRGLNEGLIIIGNESKGIRQALLEQADEKITIPKRGEGESLNAAVATGIILSNLTS